MRFIVATSFQRRTVLDLILVARIESQLRQRCSYVFCDFKLQKSVSELRVYSRPCIPSFHVSYLDTVWQEVLRH